MTRDICANCGRWRHEHYTPSGIYIADKFAEPCMEYSGREPTEKERKEAPEPPPGPQERSLCANCGRDRVDHYHPQSGIWIADDFCAEYVGVVP